MGVDMQSGSKQTQRVIASTSRNIESNATRVVGEVRILYLPHASPPKAERPFTLQTSKLSSTIENHFNFSTERLSTLREISHTLIEQGARDDQPTGTTPRKRTIEFATEWDLTRPRDDLLREWKSNRPRAPSQLERLRMPSLEDLKNIPLPISPEPDVEPEDEEDETARPRVPASYRGLGSSVSSSTSSRTSKAKMDLTPEDLVVVPQKEEVEQDERLFSSSNPSLGSSSTSDSSEAFAPTSTHTQVPAPAPAPPPALAPAPAPAPSIPAPTKMRTRTMSKIGLPTTAGSNHVARGSRRAR